MGAREQDFQLRAAPHEQLLRVLGSFEFEIFAEVAVAAGLGDLFAVLRNLLLYDVVEFSEAFVVAGPRDNQRLFLGGFGDEEFLNERKFFDQSSHQRAAVEFIERRAAEKLARDATDQIGGRIGD